jgi:BirA family biotin operon repressor/biotin-[acetyl-CoA-carboxylase] ligase
MISIDNLTTSLNTEFLGRQIKYMEETPSTNNDTWNFFQKNAPEGTLVITNNQIDGRGRRNSKWLSTPNKSLTFSFLLFPKKNLENLSLLPLLTGISIIKGIQNITKIKLGLKWPNDIMADQKKIGGILIESNSNDEELGIVIGIGININESEYDIPVEICNKASSLHVYSGKEFDLSLILSSILNEFENLYLNDWSQITTLWGQYCIHQDNEIVFHDNEKKIEGKFMGITNSGHAQIQLNGKLKTFSSGMIIL